MRTETGFTLIEILVAMVLLVGGMVAVMSSFASSSKLANNNYGPAYNYGRGLMEQMKESVSADPALSVPGARLSITNPAQFPATNINGAPCTSIYAVNPDNLNDPNGIVDANLDGQEDYRVVRMAVTC